MSLKARRLVMGGLLIGGPLGGWLLNGDRGMLFGLIVSLLAIVWFFFEERKVF